MKTLRLFALPLLLPAVCLGAEPDSDLPQPFNSAELAPVVQNSPFTRMVNMSDNLILTGIAYIDGKPVATILNKETRASYVVSETPNPQGWQLTEALPAPDIARSQAKITIGGEVVSVRYDAAAMTAKRESSSRSSDGRGPSSGSSDDRYRRSSRGPSEEDRQRYESLSESAKEKLRNVMREKFSDEKFRSAPEEERRAMMRREFEKIEEADKKGRR